MKKIGIVGCGAIGGEIALFIDQNLSAKAKLISIADKNKFAAKALNKKLSKPARINSLKNLVKKTDLIIEAASQEAAQETIKEALTHKKDLIILSVGALIKKPDYLKKIKNNKINLYIPSGAICGIDGFCALSKGNFKQIKITTSKPPAGLIGTKYLKKKNINLSKIIKPTIVFSGTVSEAIKYFPKNINVAATLMLASRFDNVRVAIKVDSRIKRNIHRIEAIAEEAKIKLEVENMPSKTNPKTSALTILSTQALLEKIFYSLKIGS